MRDPARIDRIIEALRVLWHEHPDQRLGQLVWNVLQRGGMMMSHPFQVEDDIAEVRIERAMNGDWT